jgi:hypothetical protein
VDHQSSPRRIWAGLGYRACVSLFQAYFRPAGRRILPFGCRKADYAIGSCALLPESKGLMEKSTRTWMAICAAICGVLAVIAWSVAIYVFVTTPSIHELVLPSAHGEQVTQSKAAFLSISPLIQTWFFVMLVVPTIAWNGVLKSAAKTWAPFDPWQTKRAGMTFATHCKFNSTVVCVLSIWNLYWGLQRVVLLFNVASG